MIDALIVAGVTAVVTALLTGYVSGKVQAARLKDLTDRVIRIEQYLNGLLEKRE
jgi:hypothetical protein